MRVVNATPGIVRYKPDELYFEDWLSRHIEIDARFYKSFIRGIGLSG